MTIRSIGFSFNGVFYENCDNVDLTKKTNPKLCVLDLCLSKSFHCVSVYRNRTI